MTRRPATEWTRLRDILLFVGGMLGVIYETVLEQVDRPTLLALFGGMLGLPVFLRRDERADPPPKPDPPAHRAGDE